jgi:hypothetical protein
LIEKRTEAKTTIRLAPLIVFVWALLSAPAFSADCASEDQFCDHVIKVGKIANPNLNELSGLAPSRLNSKVLWAINDGGNQPLLFAVGTDGSDLGSIPIAGARNLDWEDIASFKYGDAAYLLIADTGDNLGRRNSCTIYVIKEPNITPVLLQKDRVAEITTRINFTYENGRLDCEAVAVDVSRNKILLLSKRTLPVTLYELPLEVDKKNVTVIARRKVDVSPSIVMPTAMDISPQGDTAVVLTYKEIHLFVRRTGEDWSKRFTLTPQTLSFNELPQQEAICFTWDGQSVYVSSEGQSVPLLRINIDSAPWSRLLKRVGG